MAQMDFAALLQQQLTGMKRPGTTPLTPGTGEQQVRTQQGASSTSQSGNPPPGAQVWTGTGYQQFAPISVSDFQRQEATPAGQSEWGDSTFSYAERPESWSVTNQTQYGFPQVVNDANYTFAFDEAGNPTLRVKSADKEGTILTYKKQGDYYVPEVTGTQYWDTNNRGDNLGMLTVLGAAALGAGASYFGGFGGAVPPPGVTEAAVAGGSSIVPAATIPGMSVPGAAGTVGMSLAPAATSLSVAPAAGAVAGTGLTVGNVMSGINSGMGFLGDFNKLFGGSSSSSTSGSSREVKQTQLSPEAIMEIVRKIFEDPNMGVQSIMSGAGKAGTFGGSNEALMMSNLIARAAGQAALASAPTVTESTGQTSGNRKDRTAIEDLFRRWF